MSVHSRSKRYAESDKFVRPTESTLKRLFAVSSNRCAFPKCTTPLVHLGKVTGRVAHICAQSPGGPRYDATQTDEERHAFDNLLLLCGAHHDVVDDDPEAYTVSRLRQMKSTHEAGAISTDSLSSAQLVALLESNVSSGRDSTVVTSVNQSGGITAAHVTVNQAPDPDLSARELFVNQKSGNQYHSRLELTILSPYPPANLMVKVHAPSIVSAELNPQRGGMVMKGHSGRRDGWAFDNLQAPSGRIHLDIVTQHPESPTVEWDIQ